MMPWGVNWRVICFVAVAGIVAVIVGLFERSNIRYGRAKYAALASFKEFHGTGVTVYFTSGRFWGVRIDDRGFTDEDARRLVLRLKDNEAVEFFCASGTTLTDQGCSTFAEMRHLRVIDLSGTAVTAMGVEHLRTLPRLAILILADTRVDDEVVPILAAIRSLEGVDLANTGVTDEGKARLECLRPDIMVNGGSVTGN